MNVLRLNLLLEGPELLALNQMARADYRHPREELRYLLREEARRRGLLVVSNQPPYEAANADSQITMQDREAAQDER